MKARWIADILDCKKDLDKKDLEYNYQWDNFLQVLVFCLKCLEIFAYNPAHYLDRQKYVRKIGAHRPQCFSHKMNDRHPLQLKKLKSWEPFWSYQLNSTADLANLAQF